MRQNILMSLILSSALLLANSPIEKKIVSTLQKVETDTDFTLMLRSKDNKAFSFSRGKSTPQSMYRSASASKWVATVVILDLVKEGKLSLDDHPQKYIKRWSKKGERSKIKLRHLLNFTSGLTKMPWCINFAFGNFEHCTTKIANKNKSSKHAGSSFYYGASHLQVAGLMAVKASGLGSWEKVFEAFKRKTHLFSKSQFDLPSKKNPRLSAGMHFNAEEYLEFLEALYTKKILTPQLIKEMESDQIKNAIIERSPAKKGINEDWHYGYGNWIECHNSKNNCTQTTKVSSPGAFGAYPFIDYEHGYYGILAREGRLGTFVNGYRIFEKVSDDLELWSQP